VPGDITRHRPVEHPMPTAATVKELYATALRCGHPDCRQPLYRISSTGARVPNSQVAHIHARRENGPRWNPAMTAGENRSYDNLIVLCLEHASEIDITPEYFPAEKLRGWKRDQVATQERAAKSLPPLTDAEAGNVIRQSLELEKLALAKLAELSGRYAKSVAEVTPDMPRRDPYGALRRDNGAAGPGSHRRAIVRRAWIAAACGAVVIVLVLVLVLVGMTVYLHVESPGIPATPQPGAVAATGANF
jgi:hypothetical protein